MQKKLIDFAHALGLSLTGQQAKILSQYAELVWQKKEMLNLTSVSDKQEIYTRHICDGLAGAAFLAHYQQKKSIETVADMGSGAGYIGVTLAIALPSIQVSLIESLERRCMFLNWAIMKLALKNIKVINIRLGQQTAGLFDVVTERAMGQLQDILPLLVGSLKEDGMIAAYQSHSEGVTSDVLKSAALTAFKAWPYKLPGEDRTRYLAVFKKYGYC